MKIQNNKTKTVTTIIASLAIGLIMLSPMTVLPDISAYGSNTSSIADDCTHSMSNEMHSNAATLDERKAISLASSDSGFKSMIQGYNSKFATVFNTWHLDKIDCTVSWNDVNVGYVLSNSHGYVKNVVVTLDPSLTKIIGVNAYIAPHFANATSAVWSGYELGNGNQVSEAHLTSTIPPVIQAITATNQCVPTSGVSPGCDLAVWTGLEDTSGRIAQGGSDGNLTCNNTSCTSPTYNYFLWFEELPHPAFTCHNALISSGDSVTTDVQFTGTIGSTGYYNISVQDTSASYGCSVTNDGFEMTNPSAAPFIDERADYGTEGKDELAKFTSDQMTGSIAFNGGALGSITSSEILVSDNMKNPTTENISVSGISSGAFTQYYVTSTGT